MDEEEAKRKEAEERADKEKEDAGKNKDAGSKSETTPLIDIANAAAERMEKANEETARLQAVQAERDQRRALGGRAEAGQTPKVETEDEKWAKDAKERYEGTGMDPTPDDSPTEFK